MSNQFVNNNSPPTDSDQPYYQSYKSIESIDLFVQRNNQTNSLLYGKCDFMTNEYVLQDNLIGNQLIGDRFDSQLNSPLNGQLSEQLNGQFGHQLNSDHRNLFDDQLNQFHNNGPLIIDKPADKLGSLLIADVVKCSQSARSSDDEFNDEKALDQARQNNDSALSMCSSDDSVVMITKFESLAKIMKDQNLQPGDFLSRENSLYNQDHGVFSSDNQVYAPDDKQLNSTSVTPSSFDQQIHTATGSSFSSIEHTPSNNHLSDQLPKSDANCVQPVNSKPLCDCVHTSDENDDVKQQDKTLTGEQINPTPDAEEEEEWNFDERRKHSAEDSLLPLKEDLADWINRIFGEFFFPRLPYLFRFNSIHYFHSIPALHQIAQSHLFAWLTVLLALFKLKKLKLAFFGEICFSRVHRLSFQFCCILIEHVLGWKF